MQEVKLWCRIPARKQLSCMFLQPSRSECSLRVQLLCYNPSIHPTLPQELNKTEMFFCVCSQLLSVFCLQSPLVLVTDGRPCSMSGPTFPFTSYFMDCAPVTHQSDSTGTTNLKCIDCARQVVVEHVGLKESTFILLEQNMDKNKWQKH